MGNTTKKIEFFEEISIFSIKPVDLNSQN